jgi:hypothetical protein
MLIFFLFLWIIIYTTNIHVYAQSRPWEVSLVCGTNTSGYVDGTGTNALFAFPWGSFQVTPSTLIVADAYNSIYRSIDVASGNVTTLVGNFTLAPGYAEGIGTSAIFNTPYAVAGTTSLYYLADTGMLQFIYFFNTGTFFFCCKPYSLFLFNRIM